MSNFISFESLSRPPKPNTFLVAPEGLCQSAKPDLISPGFSASPRGLFSQINEIIAAERAWKDLEVDADLLRIRFVARTPFLGFRDDVDIAVLAPGGDRKDTTLAIYSRSRIGHSDFGANKKRVRGLLNHLTAK